MGKRKKEEDEHDEFIVLFTALSMILLAFFILLNTMAVIDPMRSKEAMDSLVGTFGIMTGNQEGDVVDLSEQQLQENMAMALIASFKGEKNYPGMDVEVQKDGDVLISMDNDVFFAPGSWHLDPARFEALEHIAGVLQKPIYSAHVVGHTDASRSAKISNLRLSAARAASVRRYIEHSAGFPPGKLISIGVGSSQPRPGLGANDPRHRRVDILIKINPASAESSEDDSAR